VGGGLLGGAPVYPTVVARTPGCLRRDSAGSQKHPMPNVASRTADRGMLPPLVAIRDDFGDNANGDNGSDGSSTNPEAGEALHARINRNLLADASVGGMTS